MLPTTQFFEAHAIAVDKARAENSGSGIGIVFEKIFVVTVEIMMCECVFRLRINERRKRGREGRAKA
jgi:hypothetical protein